MGIMVFPYWSTQIAARLLWIMFRWGDKSEIYSDRDIPSLTYLLEVVMQTSAIVYNRDRLADAVYRTPAGRSKVTPRKESDILRRVGGDPERTWVARNERELEKLLFFRHTVPETIDLIVEKNRKNDPCITILSTDMAVDDAHFETLFRNSFQLYLFPVNRRQGKEPWMPLLRTLPLSKTFS